MMEVNDNLEADAGQKYEVKDEENNKPALGKCKDKQISTNQNS